MLPASTARVEPVVYVVAPFLFLLVSLLGGLRLAAADNAFVFVRPALVCLVLASLTLVLYFRSSFLAIDGWVSGSFATLKNAANIAVLITVFAATVQLYNSLMPEQGLPFWIVGFCFFWTIWNNLFADFDPKRLMRSMIALFGLAFAVKYLVLANFSAPPGESHWLQRIIENPGKEALTYLLDLRQYSAGTGYIQFVTLGFYLIGLFVMPRRTD